MKLNDDSRTRLLIDMTLDTDPTGSTVELKIDETWYPCTWQGSPVNAGNRWTQTMRTTGYFAGPLAVASGATVLALGRHLTETRVSWPGGDIIVSESSPIDVKTSASVGPPATDARVAATVTALDADATSAFRVQSDARLSASIGGVVTPAITAEVTRSDVAYTARGAAKNVPWPTGLLAFWDFQGATDAERLRSKLGIGSFQLVQAGTTNAVPGTSDGPFGKALDFTGTQYLKIAAADVGALNIATFDDTVTVVAWVKRTADAAGFLGGIWGEATGDPRRQYGFFVDLSTYGGDDSVCFHISRTGAASPSITFSRDYSATARRVSHGSPTQAMRMMAGTYDGSQIVSYLDGVDDDHPAGVFTEPTGPVGDGTNTRAKNPYVFDLGLNRVTAVEDFTIGACKISTGLMGNFLQGALAGVAIFRGALTQADLMRINLATMKQAALPFWRENFHNPLTSDGARSPVQQGWRAYRTSTGVDTSSSNAVGNFQISRLTGAVINRYLTRSVGDGSNTTAGLGAFIRPFGMRLSQLRQVKFTLNNSHAADTVRLAVKVAGSWYATDATYSVTGDGRTGSDWSTAEVKTVTIERTAALWRDVTFTAGAALSIAGTARGTDVPNGEIQGVGFYNAGLSSGSASVRIDDLELYG